MPKLEIFQVLTYGGFLVSPSVMQAVIENVMSRDAVKCFTCIYYSTFHVNYFSLQLTFIHAILAYLTQHRPPQQSK